MAFYTLGPGHLERSGIDPLRPIVKVTYWRSIHIDHPGGLLHSLLFDWFWVAG